MGKVKIILLRMEMLLIRASEWLTDDEPFDAEWMDARKYVMAKDGT